MTHPRPTFAARRCYSPAGFTVMELMVAVSIVLVLGVIAFPVYGAVRTRANQTEAVSRLRQLGVACTRFTNDHDNILPKEDVSGKDSWKSLSDPDNANIWYNALPRAASQKGAADYIGNFRDFYKKDNMLYLPGATYPPDDRKLAEPIFAYAINSRLQRKASDGVKNPVRTTQIIRPARTVMFFERGIKGEKKALAAQPGYDGRPKGNGRAFVARYNGKGTLLFADGHVESVKAADIMDEAGQLHFPQNDIIWTCSPDDNPN